MEQERNDPPASPEGEADGGRGDGGETARRRIEVKGRRSEVRRRKSESRIQVAVFRFQLLCFFSLTPDTRHLKP
jgi:hypothetical protein